MSKSEVEEDLKEKAASLVEYVSFLLEYLESYSQNPEVSDFLTLLTVLQVQQNSLATRSFPDINIHSAAYFTEQLMLFLVQVYTEEFSKWQNKGYDQINMQIIGSKLKTVQEFFNAALHCELDDLLFTPKSDARWKKLEDVVVAETVENEEEITASFRDFTRLIAVGNAFISKGMSADSELTQKLLVGASAGYYFLFRDSACKQAEKSYSKPNVYNAQLVWNLLDSKLIQKTMGLVIPSIGTNKVIFLHPNQPGFSRSHESGSIPLRVLHSGEVPALRKRSIWPATCASRDKPHDTIISREVIYHIHGGGFISMSSASHQNYTRQWAKQLQTPVLSVDYRLAPQYPYPAALDDAWNAYFWILNNAKESLGIVWDRIVIAGDSAGGNLALGVMARWIERGVRAPDGLLLAYPALNMDVESFTPSYLIALNDLMIPHTFIKLCLEAYVQSQDLDPATDHFLSPIKTPNDILATYPPIRMMVGTHDPLHDDCWRFAERWMEAGLNIKMKVYERMMHGFLSFDYKIGGVKETRATVVQSAEYIRDLLSFI